MNLHEKFQLSFWKHVWSNFRDFLATVGAVATFLTIMAILVWIPLYYQSIVLGGISAIIAVWIMVVLYTIIERNEVGK